MNGIERTKGVCGGRPVVEGTRIEPEILFHMFMHTGSIASVLTEYPQLDTDQVQAAIRFVCASACPCKACAWAKKIPVLEASP